MSATTQFGNDGGRIRPISSLVPVLTSALAVVILLCAARTTSAQVTVSNMLTAQSVDVSCSPTPTQRSNFLTTGGVVWLWYLISGVKKGDTGEIDWIDPTGKTAAVFQILPASADLPDNWCFYWDLAIGTGTALGNWNVSLEMNGQQIFSLPFPSPSPSLSSIQYLTYWLASPRRSKTPIMIG